MADVDFGNLVVYMDFADIGTDRVGNFGGAKLDEFLGTHLGDAQLHLTRSQLQENHGLEGTDDQVRSALKTAQYQQDAGLMEPKMSDYHVKDLFGLSGRISAVLDGNMPVECIINKEFCDAATGEHYPISSIRDPASMSAQAELDIIGHKQQTEMTLDGMGMQN
jgi:hypothetical protein